MKLGSRDLELVSIFGRVDGGLANEGLVHVGREWA